VRDPARETGAALGDDDERVRAAASLSMQMMSWPKSAKQAANTKPT
jgi:hypothetical protein